MRRINCRGGHDSDREFGGGDEDEEAGDVPQEDC